MTEQEAFNAPEMKTILLLSGYARELGEGNDMVETTNNTAQQIVKLFALNAVTKPSIDRTSFLLGFASIGAINIIGFIINAF